MDWSFVVALVIGAIAALVLILGIVIDRKEKREDYPSRPADRVGGNVKTAGKIVLGFAGFFFLLSCVTVVSANSAGVFVSMGKPIGVENNGPHLKTPWAAKTEFDGRHQFLRFEGQGNSEKDSDKIFSAIMVRLSGDATAGATATTNGAVEWQIRLDTEESKAKALQLYKDYKSLESVRDNYLYPRLKTALGQVFAQVNPLVPAKNLNGAVLNDMVTAKLREIVGDTLTVHSVVLGVPDWDDITDKAIANLQTEMANTATAEQKVLTAEQEKLAAELLNQTLSGNPAYLINKCIDATVTAIMRGQTVEPGFCMSGVQSVIANSK